MRILLLVLAIGCSHHDTPAADAAVTVMCAGDTCVAGSEYCYLQEVGLGVVSPPEIGCNALPPSCASTPTCGCVLPTVPSCGGGLTCDDSSGVATVICALP